MPAKTITSSENYKSYSLREKNILNKWEKKSCPSANTEKKGWVFSFRNVYKNPKWAAGDFCGKDVVQHMMQHSSDPLAAGGQLPCGDHSLFPVQVKSAQS